MSVATILFQKAIIRQIKGLLTAWEDWLNSK